MYATLLTPLALALALATTPTAAAVPPPAVTPAPNLELRLEAGVASPIGEGGLTLTRWFTDAFGIEGGFGSGLTGLQVSVMPKLATGTARHIWTVGVGPSGSLPLQGPTGVTSLLWVNGEIGHEFRFGFENKWVLGASVGAAVGIAGRMSAFRLVVDDEDNPPTDVAGKTFPYVRVGVGRRF